MEMNNTAIIMSREEALALPIKKRPICFRISSEIYTAVFEHIGEASMCWNPLPGDNVFACEQASDVAVRLCFKIADEVEKSKSSALRDALKIADTFALNHKLSAPEVIVAIQIRDAIERLVKEIEE